MERVQKDKAAKKLGGGLKDLPLCEHCGKPVRITSEDFTREEILCPHCAADASVSAMDDYDGNTNW